ncbi:hypothetical protein PMIN01_11493 [Paraphaeosphaeria minitans]|uniref:Uncharacterized protein n=1 Tax=Paraphaeosphaeria minitans TaxID=565426 RepID=A0A9P6GAF2_9PLEO|nr:hypothetical protein PMIN01_11493 [Paraphaeosphaeria minitans]
MRPLTRHPSTAPCRTGVSYGTMGARMMQCSAVAMLALAAPILPSQRTGPPCHRISGSANPLVDQPHPPSTHPPIHPSTHPPIHPSPSAALAAARRTMNNGPKCDSCLQPPAGLLRAAPGGVPTGSAHHPRQPSLLVRGERQRGMEATRESEAAFVVTSGHLETQPNANTRTIRDANSMIPSIPALPERGSDEIPAPQIEILRP